MRIRYILLLLVTVLASSCCKEAEIPNASRGLYSNDHREKTKALQVLAQCGLKAEPSVQRIAALMYDKNVGVASAAAYALRKIDSPEARQALKTAEDARARKRGR
jgi:HEAT repeat protein